MQIIEIDVLKDNRLELYTSYNEVELLHYFEPEAGIFIAETPVVIERAIERGAQPLSFLIEEKAFDSEPVQQLLAVFEDEDVDVFVAPLDMINQLTGFNLTRGVLCAMRRPSMPTVEEILSSSCKIAIMEDVLNPTNIGAIFRSAAALGVDGILITADSTDPFYRRAARVSMGTVFQVPWTYLPKDVDINKVLHRYEFTTVAMALKENAVPLDDTALKNHEKLAVIFGTESTGITDDTIAGCDYTAIIPMSNEVDSLNVAAASAVTFWELFK